MTVSYPSWLLCHCGFPRPFPRPMPEQHHGQRSNTCRNCAIALERGRCPCCRGTAASKTRSAGRADAPRYSGPEEESVSNLSDVLNAMQKSNNKQAHALQTEMGARMDQAFLRMDGKHNTLDTKFDHVQEELHGASQSTSGIGKKVC